MKIVMFQYNREASAIISENTLSQTTSTRQNQAQSHLNQKYNDRFLWEGVATFKEPPKNEYIILGNWQ